MRDALWVRDARAAANDARKRHPERPELAWIVAVQHAGKFLNRLVLPPMIDITRPDVHWEYADSLTTR